MPSSKPLVIEIEAHGNDLKPNIMMSDLQALKLLPADSLIALCFFLQNEVTALKDELKQKAA